MNTIDFPGRYQSRVNLRALSGFLSLFLIMIFSFSGCSSSTPDVSEGDSELVISLTDAEGDFLTYTVDVVSLKMIKSNGAEVETLPLTTRLDFAQYVEVSEFLTAATVPSGHYTEAQVVLDFTDAEITVQDENGDAIKAKVQDVSGGAVGLMTVKVSINGDSDFVIAPGIPAHITLDFDLDASNAVIINGSEATVVVSPVLVADTVLEQPKPHRLRGALARVDQAANQFSVLMRPFRHRAENRFGQLDVHVSEHTSYEIDGQMYDAASGLAQLDQLSPASAVIVRGVMGVDRHQFHALEVYAGSSVPWGHKDMVSGNVISRSGNTLIVRGATLIRADGSFIFNDNVSVVLNDNTSVVKQAEVNNSYGINDISVGQKVLVLGSLGERAGFNAEHVRMLFTDIAGTVVSASPLAMDLQAISSRRIMLFDFTGTGSDALSDADADYYEVDTGVLNLANLQLGDPVKVRGHVRSFATAPEDFSAQTILDAGSMPAHMVIGYGDGSLNAVANLSESGLQLNLDDAGNKRHIYRAGISTDLFSLPVMPLIAPRESGSGLFVITQGVAVNVYTSYSSFQTALNDALDGSTAVVSVHAHGVYDVDQNQIQSAKITLRLAD